MHRTVILGVRFSGGYRPSVLKTKEGGSLIARIVYKAKGIASACVSKIKC